MNHPRDFLSNEHPATQAPLQASQVNHQDATILAARNVQTTLIEAQRDQIPTDRTEQDMWDAERWDGMA